jgi:hypothetical protein
MPTFCVIFVLRQLFHPKPITMLNIVKEIESLGLDAVVAKYSLVCKDAGHKILLKYHQIDSAFARAVPAVRECRGLILEKSTMRPMSYPFYRFFNLGEGCADQLDYSTARVYKKEDGSLIGLYWDWVLGEWAVQTSGTADALTPVGDNTTLTFRELFLTTLGMDLTGFNKDLCYVFELCTPYNVVVTPHTVGYVKVLTIRNMTTLFELSHDAVAVECNRLGLTQVESYQFDIHNIVAIAKELPAVEEGYVVCDAAFNRIKIKNPGYVALHHLKGSLSKAELFEVIFKGEESEIIALMPNFTEPLMSRSQFFAECVNTITEFVTGLSAAPYTTKKDFALWLQAAVKDKHPIVSAASGFFYRYADNILRGEVVETLNARDIVVTVGSDKLEKIFT